MSISYFYSSSFKYSLNDWTTSSGSTFFNSSSLAFFIPVKFLNSLINAFLLFSPIPGILSYTDESDPLLLISLW